MPKQFLLNPTALPQVLAIGGEGARALQSALAPLARIAGVRSFPSVREATEWFEAAAVRPVIDWVVLLQSRPGEVCQHEVTALKRATPLSRFVVVLGSACEGETRSGRPLVGVERAMWYDWPALVEREFRGPLDSAAIPASARSASQRRLIGIRTRQLVEFEALSVVCRDLLDASSRWLDPRRELLPHSAETQEPLSAVLWNGRYGEGDEQAEIAIFADRFPGVPLVGIFTFPRWDDAQAVRSLGMTDVLARPFRIADLAQALGQARMGAIVRAHDAA